MSDMVAEHETLDDEEFCANCFAGIESDEHFEQCVADPCTNCDMALETCARRSVECCCECAHEDD